MSVEENKALIREMVAEVINKGNVSWVDEFVSPDFIEHEELPPEMPGGREGVKLLAATMQSAFTDFKAVIDDLIAEDDKVVIRMTWSGTHNGEFMGIPATGRPVSFGVLDVVRVVDGKAAEHWGLMDSMGLMQQLGVLPDPEGE